MDNKEFNLRKDWDSIETVWKQWQKVQRKQSSILNPYNIRMLTGSGKYLENLVKEKLGIKVRSVELNVCQRCSSSCLSATDLDEAAASGRFAVSAALDGETGKMINFIRKSDDPYILEFGTADVNEICNKEKAVPEEWITKDGSDIGDEFIAYARPLIQGSVEVPMKDGLPYFAFRKQSCSQFVHLSFKKPSFVKHSFFTSVLYTRIIK